MGYQIIIVMMLIKNTGERGSGRVGGGGGGGYKCQAICQLSVTVYMIIND